jgi:hypothetical protein
MMRNLSDVSKLKDDGRVGEKKGIDLNQNIHQRTKQQSTTFTATTWVRDALKRESPSMNCIYQCPDVVEKSARPGEHIRKD